jgi:hypothetical protein
VLISGGVGSKVLYMYVRPCAVIAPVTSIKQCSVAQVQHYNDHHSSRGAWNAQGVGLHAMHAAR